MVKFAMHFYTLLKSSKKSVNGVADKKFPYPTLFFLSSQSPKPGVDIKNSESLLEYITSILQDKQLFAILTLLPLILQFCSPTGHCVSSEQTGAICLKVKK